MPWGPLLALRPLAITARLSGLFLVAWAVRPERVWLDLFLVASLVMAGDSAGLFSGMCLAGHQGWGGTVLSAKLLEVLEWPALTP